MLDLVLASMCVCVLVCVGVSSAHFQHSQPASHHEVPFQQKLDPSAKQALDKKWKESKGLIFYDNRIYVPKNHRLCEQIIETTMTTPRASWTQELIQHDYWWPQMQKMICRYVDRCIKCQEDKINQQPLHTPLNPHDIPKQPWQKVTADMIRPLPESNSFNAIEVFADMYSHCIHVEPTHLELSAEVFTNLVQDRVIATKPHLAT